MIVAIGGSRHLQEEALIRAILQHVQKHGWRVATGCARGIDKTVRDVADREDAIKSSIGKETRINAQRLRPGSNGYRLLEDGR